jgi:hypothetical protein
MLPKPPAIHSPWRWQLHHSQKQKTILIWHSLSLEAKVTHLFILTIHNHLHTTTCTVETVWLLIHNGRPKQWVVINRDACGRKLLWFCPSIHLPRETCQISQSSTTIWTACLPNVNHIHYCCTNLVVSLVLIKFNWSLFLVCQSQGYLSLWPPVACVYILTSSSEPVSEVPCRFDLLWLVCTFSLVLVSQSQGVPCPFDLLWLVHTFSLALVCQSQGVPCPIGLLLACVYILTSSSVPVPGVPCPIDLLWLVFTFPQALVC